MQGVADHLKKLDGDTAAIRRVLDWAVAAFLPLEGRVPGVLSSPTGMTMRGSGAITPGTGSIVLTGQQPQVAQSVAWDTLPELYAAASPNSDADRALVVGYYFQKVKGVDNLDSFTINKSLRHLGFAASNITSALNSLIERRPQLAIQTHKSGSSRQARKRYRLTNEGLRAVERMLEGDANG